MKSRHANLIYLWGLAVLVATMAFHNRHVEMAFNTVTMLLLALGAIVVGAIPRRVRTRREKIVSWIIGWPMFATFLVLMAASVYDMWVSNAPECVLLFAFFWVLAYLTWKVFIDPNTGPGGWWRRGPKRQPRGPAPFPVNRGPRPVRDVGATVVAGVTANPISALTGKPHHPWR
jgi:hypothetical protein